MHAPDLSANPRHAGAAGSPSVDRSRLDAASVTALTNTALDAMADGEELKDDRVPGLSARKHKSGVSFMLYYRPHFKAEVAARRIKIGAYPLIPLAAAREIARGLLAKVAAGQDPKAERNRAKGEPTMDDLAAR